MNGTRRRCGGSRGGESRSGGGGSGRWRGKRCRRAGPGDADDAAHDAEPLENIVFLSLNVVRNALRADGLEIRAVRASRPPIDGGVLLDLAGRGGVAKDVGPLLDGLAEVVVVQGRVTVLFC